jgi:hypothetical protein
VQEVKIINIVNHGADCLEDLTSAMVNEWTSKGWQLHTVLLMPKTNKKELPPLCVVLVREVVPE